MNIYHVTFAWSAFLNDVYFGNESVAASTIGHELIHTIYEFRPDECPAYFWEVDNANMTGISFPHPVLNWLGEGYYYQTIGEMLHFCEEENY